MKDNLLQLYWLLFNFVQYDDAAEDDGGRLLVTMTDTIKWSRMRCEFVASMEQLRAERTGW